MRFLYLSLLLPLMVTTVTCGGGSSGSSSASGTQPGPLSSNWQISLDRHANPGSPLVYTGFLLQSGNSVSGSLIFLPDPTTTPGCPGVDTVSGTVDGQNVSFTLNENGEEVSLTGTMPTGGAPMGGQFSNLAGGCTNFPNTGTWTAIPIAPINGSFHGTITSSEGNGSYNVAGTLTQGPNTGSSNADLSGTVSDTGTPRLCYDLSQATVRGFISGENITLIFYGADGLEIAQSPVPAGISVSAAPMPTVVSPDGKSITGGYDFPPLPNNPSLPVQPPCQPGDSGTFQLSFP